MSYSTVSTAVNATNSVGYLFDEDPISMRMAINQLTVALQAALKVIEEHDHAVVHIDGELLGWNPDEFAERLEECERLAGYAADVADVKKGAPGPKGDRGPKGEVGPSHPDVKESIERLKDVEDRIEELELAMEALEA